MDGRTAGLRATVVMLVLGCSRGDDAASTKAAPPAPDAQPPAAAATTPTPATTTPATTTPTPTPSSAIVGTWAPAPGRDLVLASTDDTFFAVQAVETPGRFRIHAARRAAGAWDWVAPFDVPRAPQLPPDFPLDGVAADLGVHARGSAIDVTLNRVEYQGGSHGIMLTTLENGVWSAVQEIPSPLDSDMAFGAPPIRRGTTLLTSACSEELWHFTQGASTWSGQRLALATDGSIVCPPPMDANDDASTFLLGYALGSTQWLGQYRRGASGAYMIAATRLLPAAAIAIHDAGSTTWIAFGDPVGDGAVVWGVDPSLPEPMAAKRTISLPPPHHGRGAALQELDANASWLLMEQPDAMWVAGATEREPLRSLELPPSKDGLERSPSGRLVGDVAVVLVDGQLGTFVLR